MQYYIIKGDTSFKTTGLKNGERQADLHYDKWDSVNRESYQDILMRKDKSLIGKISTNPINMDYVQLEPNAKLSDFILYNNALHYAPFIISRKALDITNCHNLGHHAIHPVNLYSSLGEPIHDYYLLQSTSLNEYFDFDKIITVEKSSFYYMNSLRREKKYYSFKSWKTAIEWRRESILKHYIDTIAINREFDRTLDLFMMDNAIYTYISPRLKNAIQKAGLTGVDIIESKDPKVVWEEFL